MGNNGKDYHPQETYYQTKPALPYTGKERRDNPYDDRIVFTPKEREMIRAMRCNKGCIIPRDFQPHVGHACGAVADIGSGDPAKGINEIRDQHKTVKNHLSLLDSAKRKALMAMITLIIGGLGVILTLGVIEYVKRSG